MACIHKVQLIGLALAACAVHAQTPWPLGIADLQPGDSVNPFAVALPETSAPSRPATAKAESWAGRWTGYSCRRRQCDVKLVVDEVTETEATVTVGFSSNTRELLIEKARGTFVDRELRVSLSLEPALLAGVALRLRPTNVMEMVRLQAADPVGGVLTKVEHFPAKTPSAPVSFDGTWVLYRDEEGKLGREWDRRIQIQGQGSGHLYAANRSRGNDPLEQCRNVDTPLEEVSVADTFITFVTRGNKALPGCVDARWVIEKRGDKFGGAEQAFGPGMRATRGVFIAVKTGS